MYEYGARWYDPAIGRFTGVDPIADQFPHLSVYNYASNDPVKNIDLHGLQGFNSNFIFNGALSSFRQQLGAPDQKINDAVSSIPADTRQRAGLAIKGAGNMTLGILGTIGGASVTGGSGGLATPAGAAIMTMSLTEASIGLAQVSDAIFGKGDGESALHQSTSGPGLVANVAGSEHAGLIDVSGEILPGLLGGGLKAATGMADVIDGAKSLSKGKIGQAALQLFQANDAQGDFRGFIEEASNSLQKIQSAQSLQSSGPTLSKQQIQDIDNFINKSE